MNWISVKIHEPGPDDYRPTGRILVRHVMDGEELFMTPTLKAGASAFNNKRLGITHWCRIERPKEHL